MKSKIRIRNTEIGQGCPILVIAEVACAHEGSYEKLIKLIDIAIESGAGAVKFQVLNAEDHMAPSHEIYDLVKTFEFSKDEWVSAVKYLREKSSILILTDIYDEASIGIVKEIDPDMIKIHSSDLNNYRLLEKASLLKKPTLFGIGASTIDEIRDAVDFYQKRNPEFLGLLHGYQAFPTRVSELHINQIQTIKNYFQLPVGFLDHTDGDSEESLYMPLVARGAGAFAIEKHITIDRKEKGIDYESALSLENFKKMVKWLKNSNIAMGNTILQPLSESEKRYRFFMKKNIVAALDLKKESVLQYDDLKFKRASNGITAENYTLLIGRKLKVDIKKDQIISFNMLTEGEND